MSDAQKQFWHSAQFYKGYLPVKEMAFTQKYVILARKLDLAAWPTLTGKFNSSVGDSSLAMPGAIGVTPPLTLTPDTNAGSGEFAHFPSSEAGAMTLADSGADPSGFDRDPTRSRVAFYMYLKKDILPPPLKYTLSSKQLNHCFFVCEQENCNCDCPHVKPGVWQLRVDRLRRTAMTASERGDNRRLQQRDIVPTAGYFFALGLLILKVVQAVVPTMCRFNKECKHGCMCLYIHADVTPGAPVNRAAEIPLKDVAGAFVLDVCNGDEAERKKFFDFLDDEGMATVGDVQVLGMPAFESLASTVPSGWAEAFLITSLIRDFDRKALLSSALSTFPRVVTPVQLPDDLVTIGDLLNLPSSAFYHLELMPHVMDAMEIIRGRYDSDEAYNVITLAKEPVDSFFGKLTKIINDFSTDHAHNSWRKHDPTRPLVTSVITYVDVLDCHCSPDGIKHGESIFKDEMPTVRQPPTPPGGEIGYPRRSWCTCPRRWEIAVNYELSTPSGSRCSEQNVMGKLAALGVPTWAVRDVVVHGHNIKKEANPLFPCGVCENMLQKVNKDVESQYGGDVTLFMFDATVPKKIVYLPVQEISHRDGHSFKRFVAQDLRK